MQDRTILLLDADPIGGLGAALLTILRDAPIGRVQTHQERVRADTDLADLISRTSPDLIVFAIPSVEVRRAEGVLLDVRKARADLPVLVVVQGYQSFDLLQLFKLGIADLALPPLRANDIVPRLRRLLDRAASQEAAVEAAKLALSVRQFLGESPRFLAQIRRIPLMARCDVSMLILGETGSGKELCARTVHYLSHRSHKPLIPVNCGAIPVELMENELFGHEQGAYTSAASARSGVIQEADGGTLFLDEIDCLPLTAQVKLLRFLQDKEFRPLGSPRKRHADVRVIAATNVEIEQAVRQGRVRLDLYYRLNVISLHLPPLRERQEDIPILARHFLKKYAAEFDRGVTGLSEGAMRKLLVYQWPGNVRELEHVVERAVILAEEPTIREADLVFPLCQEATQTMSFREAKAQAVAQFEKNYINGLLIASQGNITQAARAARKNRRAFWELVRKHQIDVQAIRGNAA